MKVNWHQLAAYCIVAVVAIFVVRHIIDTSSNTLYKTQLASCHAGNQLRIKFNTQIANANDAISATSTTLIAFLDTAGKARLANYEVLHEPADLKASEKYYNLAKTLKTKGYIPHLEAIPLRDCKTVVKTP